MWEYKNQIKIRWVSAGLFFISLAVLLFAIYSDGLNRYPHNSIRAMITQTSLTLETAHFWLTPFAFLLMVALLTIGVPSVLFMALLLPFFSVIKCFAIIYLAQILASIITMYISRLKKLAEKSTSPASALMIENQTSADEFAFWSRLYFSIPLRTADMLTGVVTEERQAVSNILKTAAPAIFLRMLIPTCWLNSMTAILPGLRTLPAENYSAFLMWSVIVIVYTLLPRIPELLICSKRMKHVIMALEDIKPPTPKPKPKRKRNGLDFKSSETNGALQN